MIGKQLVEFSDAFSWDHSVRIPSEVGESDRSFDLSARRTSKSRAVHRERLRSHDHDLCDLGWLEAAFVDADFISVAVSPTGLVCCDLPQSVNGGRIPRSMPRIHLWERALSVVTTFYAITVSGVRAGERVGSHRAGSEILVATY